MITLAALAIAAASENHTEVDDEELDSLGSIIDGIKSEVLGGAAIGPQTFLENVAAFRAAVDWSERWIQVILAWHVMLWLTFLLFRRHYEVQCGLFFGITLTVGGAERLNSLGRTHWEKFATQNYFDERGVFAGTLWCTPMLALSFVMLINFVCMAGNMLVSVKRREIQDSIDAEKKKAKEQAGKVD